MVTFNTVMSLAYGPPALLGLVVRRTPSWSGLASFAVALAVGAVGSFVLGWGLVTNVLTVVPASVAVFFLSRLFPETDPARAARHDDLFRRLDTPVDMAVELRGSHDPTTRGLPLPEPGDRARRPAVRAARLHRPGRASARPSSATSLITLALAAGAGVREGQGRPAPPAPAALEDVR